MVLGNPYSILGKEEGRLASQICSQCEVRVTPRGRTFYITGITFGFTEVEIDHISIPDHSICYNIAIGMRTILGNCSPILETSIDCNSLIDGTCIRLLCRIILPFFLLLFCCIRLSRSKSRCIIDI